MGWKKYLIIIPGLALIWGVIFVSTMPLRFLLDQINLPPQISVSNLSGTLWSGRTELTWQGGGIADNLAILRMPTIFIWKWCPEHGVLAMCITLDNPHLKVDTNVSYSLFGNSVTISDAVLRSEVVAYQFAVRGFDISLSGEGEVRLQPLEVSLAAPTVEKLDATAKLMNLRSDPIEIGDYDLQSSFAEGNLATRFEGGTDDFNVTGDVNVDFKKRAFQYDAELRSANEGLINLLKSHAQKSDRGRVTFSGTAPLRLP